MAILLAGETGVGKTVQAQRFPEPIAHLDFEYPRAEIKRKKYNPDRLISIFPCREIYEEDNLKKGYKIGEIDKISTYNLMIKNVDDVLKNISEYETIVLDSISDIRNKVVADKWLFDFQSRSTDHAKRKVIGKDQSAWAAINKEVGDRILFRFINMGYRKNKNIIFTAKNTDDYKLITLESGKQDTVKSGRIIDTQNWVNYEMDITIELEVTKQGKYFMTATKERIPKTDITDKSVYDVLLEMGMI